MAITTIKTTRATPKKLLTCVLLWASLLVVMAGSTFAQICTISPTIRNRLNGLSIVTDPTCATLMGSGCVSSICRYCRLPSATGYTNLPWCLQITIATRQSTPTTLVSTPAPTTVTPKPTTLAPTPTPVPTTATPAPSTAATRPRTLTTTPLPTTTAPTPTTATAMPLKCFEQPSDGDAAVGIDVATDLTCCIGGLGCISDVCRQCRRWDTKQSIHLLRCDSLSTNNGDDINFVAIPVIIDDSGLPGSINPTPPPTPMATTIPLATPIPGVTAVSPTTTAPPPTTTAPPPTTTTPTIDPCVALVFWGDQQAGVSAITDYACPVPVGCFTATCRYCQKSYSPASAHLLPCTATAKLQVALANAVDYDQDYGMMEWVLLALCCACMATFLLVVRMGYRDHTIHTTVSTKETQACAEENAPEKEQSTSSVTVSAVEDTGNRQEDPVCEPEV